MKKDKLKMAFDDKIGVEKPRTLSKSEHNEIRKYRNELYKKRSSADKLKDLLPD